MNNTKKTVSSFLILGLLACSGFLALNTASSSFERVNAESPSFSSAKTKKWAAEDFSGEVDADSNEITATVSQNNLTDTSQSLKVTFRSKTIPGYRTAIGNYVIQIDDPNFTGDEDNPVAEDYDVYDEATGFPILNGYVSFILGGSGRNANVYLPSTLTRKKEGANFIIKVTRVAANALTVDGAQYDGKNIWDKDRVKNIYIPNTMETIEAGAFTGYTWSGSAEDDPVIHYEGTTLPSGFAAGWTDAPEVAWDLSSTSYNNKASKAANVGGKLNDLPDPLGRPVNFVLGCRQDANHAIFNEPEHNKPLVVQYDRVVTENGVEKSRTTEFEELPILNENGPYDSIGPISSLSIPREFSFRIGQNEQIDPSSLVFHNIYEAGKSGETFAPDMSKPLKVVPTVSFSTSRHIGDLVSIKASMNSYFAGYSMFTLTMDKNLSITSTKYPEPHSLYLDVKSAMYEQNVSKIKTGETRIRYSLYNLYNSSYHFQYIGKNGEIKDITIPLKSVISYQELTSDKGNKVAVLLKNSAVAPDFSVDKVIMFELVDITIQMDLLTTSASGSTSILGKSSISYKFAYIEVYKLEKPASFFNWDLFLIIFFIAYVAVYVGAAFLVYKIMKEKFKNDEFRRVNGKKFIKQAALSGGGLGIVLAAVLFIIMRTSGFKNTIVVFNPTDPLLIAFSIVGMIILGYFIVYVIKLVKAERERRKAIRLKLNEDVEDDGTK